jgi:nucleotide-binding universal stress UspA family protein
MKKATAGIDPGGGVFITDQKILRGISAASAKERKALLDSGLLRRLTAAGLFPETWISSDCLPGFALTVEHARIHPLVLVREWTAAMLRDAALAVVKINRIARPFGYETRDVIDNMAFAGTQPVLFDLGSLVPIRRRNAGWMEYREFTLTFLGIMKLRGQGSVLLSRLLLEHRNQENWTYHDYLTMRLGWMAEWLPTRFIARLRDRYHNFLALGALSDAEINEKLTRQPWLWPLAWLRQSAFSEKMTANFDRLERRVQRIARRRDGMDMGRDPTAPTARQKILCELVKDIAPASVLEIGSDNGAVSMALHDLGLVRQVTYAGEGEEEVERVYDVFRRRGEGRGTAAVVVLEDEPRSVVIPRLADRYKADLVVAPFTARPSLRHGLTLESLMDRIAALCSRHAVVEFMPEGLGGHGTLHLPLPDWYTLDEFRRQFLRNFDVLREVPSDSGPAASTFLVGRRRESGAQEQAP